MDIFETLAKKTFDAEQVRRGTEEKNKWDEASDTIKGIFLGEAKFNVEAGRLAFVAYCKAVNFKSHTGQPTPEWDQLSEETQMAWAAAAAAAIEKVAPARLAWPSLISIDFATSLKEDTVAQEQALRIDQGSRFQYVIGVTGINLTGMEARMQVKAGRNNTTVILDMSDYCTVSAVDNQVIIDMPGSATSSTPWLEARYDIKLVDPNDSSKDVRILQGDIAMDQEVTI